MDPALVYATTSSICRQTTSMGSVGAYAFEEALVVRKPVKVGYDGVDIIQVGEQIQCAGSAIPSVWPVFDLHEVVFDGAHKLTMKGMVCVPKGVKRQSGRVVSVADGRCFRYGGACQDDGCSSRIGRGDNLCCQEGCVYGGGEGVAEVSERTTAKVCVDRRPV